MDPLRTAPRGFTVIELVVVLAVIALLLSIVAPRYVHSVDGAREAVLRHDLKTMRDAIDRFVADHGRHPEGLAELVTRRYLRDVPEDPLTGLATTWVLLPPADGSPGVADVRSGAPGTAADNTRYAAW